MQLMLKKIFIEVIFCLRKAGIFNDEKCDKNNKNEDDSTKNKL